MSYDVLSPDAARLWPHLPDWSSGFNVKRAFLTDIKGSRDNTEQRRATRSNPRLSVDYRTIVQDAERRAANHWLRAWQDKPAIIPDFARWALLTGSSSAGAGTLTISPLPAWAVAGQRLILCGAETEEVLVESVAGSTITLVDNLTNEWVSGSVLRPTFHGLLDASTSSTRLTKGAADIQIALEAYPGGEPARDVGTAWETYETREVFTLQPDYAGRPSVNYMWQTDRVDFSRGRTAQFRPIDRAERGVEADFTALTPTLAAETEQFFDRMKGRRTAFFMPTWEKDFELATSAAGSSFLAVGTELAVDFGALDYALADEVAIAICLVDGSHVYRTVTDIAISGGNSLVSLNGSVTLSAATVARISWMPLWRFASDEMTMSWKTPLHASARLNFQSVKG